MPQKSSNSSRPGMPHNAAAAAAAAAVAGRATLAAARAACAAACVVQASASSSGKDISIEEGYGGISEYADLEPNNKVMIIRETKATKYSFQLQNSDKTHLILRV